jgi:ribonucleoside-triphosphate reductase
MMEGDAKGRMFSFPIPTYNITEDFEWENEKLDPVWEMTAKFGIPYFSNFINSDMDPEDARSMCCRLRLDNKELRKRGGGLFGANPLTGSIGVVTLNMPRIGYQAQDKEEFMERVYYLMDQAKESLEVKRKVLETLTEQGLYPYAKFYLRDIKKRFDQYWKNHFNTIGLNGMNEALLNFMGKDISTPEGQQFSEQVMEKMRERLQQYQEETDNMYNLEATPAEGTAYRFARLDREKFGDRIVAANQERVVKEDADPYYTNSTQLPVGLTDDIFTALELQDELQSLYTGGTVLHGFLGEKINSIKATKKLVKRIAENFKLPYYTLTPSFSICPVHGYLPGEHEYCPKCEAEAEAEENRREKLKAESEVE